MAIIEKSQAIHIKTLHFQVLSLHLTNFNRVFFKTKYLNMKTPLPFNCSCIFSIFIVIFLFSFTFSFGQGWEKTYPLEGNAQGIFVKSIADGYAVVGYSHQVDIGESYIFFLKIDENGNQLELKKVAQGAGYRTINKVIALSDGGFLCAGSAGPSQFGGSSYATRLDSNGDQVWEKVFDSDTYFFTVKDMPNGSYMLGNIVEDFSGLNSFILTQINGAGNVEWTETFLTLEDNWLDFTPIDNDNFLVVGNTKENLHYYDGLIVKLNRSTGVIWKKAFKRGIYDDGFNSIEAGATGEFLLTGFSYVMSSGNETWHAGCDTEGNIAWNTLSGSWNGDTPSAGIRYGNSFAYTGNQTALWGSSMVIQQIDGSGNMVFEKLYGGELPSRGNHITQASGQQLIATGTITPLNTDADVFVVKTEDLPLTSAVEANKASAKVEPNPAQHYVNITLAGTEGGKHIFELFNTDGRLLQMEKFAGSRFTLKRKSLAAGVYFFTITNQLGEKVSGKIVFQ